MHIVTGGAGFIGSNLVAALCARGAEVMVVDRLRQGVKWRNLAKHPIAQVPIVLAPRFEGNSKMRPIDMVHGITYLVGLGLRTRLPLSSLKREIRGLAHA